MWTVYHADMEVIRKADGFENETLTVIPPHLLEQFRSHPLLESLYVTDIGFFPNARHHYREREFGAEQHILIYCIQGEGFVESRGKRHEVRPNTLLLIPQGVSHIYGADSNANPWHIYWAHYLGSRSPHYNPGPGDDVWLTYVPESKLPNIARLFHTIFNVLDRGMTLSHLIQTAHIFAYLLNELILSHSHTSLSTKPDERRDYVENAISYLQERLEENVTLDELAEWSNVSKSRLTQLFKEKTGYSPIRFFMNLKMQRACRYLDLTDFTVKQIAASLGYDDPYYFTRVFTRTIGMSPTAYRNIKKG